MYTQLKKEYFKDSAPNEAWERGFAGFIRFWLINTNDWNSKPMCSSHFSLFFLIQLIHQQIVHLLIAIVWTLNDLPLSTWIINQSNESVKQSNRNIFYASLLNLKQSILNFIAPKEASILQRHIAM